MELTELFISLQRKQAPVFLMWHALLLCSGVSGAFRPYFVPASSFMSVVDELIAFNCRTLSASSSIPSNR